MRTPDVVALAARLVPEPARRRCFEPALADLLRRRRARCRRAGPLARTALQVWFLASVTALAMEARRVIAG